VTSIVSPVWVISGLSGAGLELALSSPNQTWDRGMSAMRCFSRPYDSASLRLLGAKTRPLTNTNRGASYLLKAIASLSNTSIGLAFDRRIDGAPSALPRVWHPPARGLQQRTAQVPSTFCLRERLIKIERSRAMSAKGQKRTLRSWVRDVRFTPKSGNVG
jgi:hypothetical protein